MSDTNSIYIKGARVNNLKNIDVEIPRDKLIVITGLSGSGKSSLAFDTLYAEGQRRYVESLSAYARQFLGRMSKPECDFIKGIPPAIAIEQKVKLEMQDAAYGTAPGYKVSWVSSESKRVDSQRLKKEQPEIFNQYSKNISSRRLTIVHAA